jgi:type III secretion system needle length determinant
MSNMDIRFSNERAVSSLETDGKTSRAARPADGDVQLFLDALGERSSSQQDEGNSERFMNDVFSKQYGEMRTVYSDRAWESPDMLKHHDLESGFLRQEKTPKQGQGSDTAQQEAMSLQDMFKGTMNPFEMMFSGKVDAPSQTPPPSLDQGQIEKMVERILVSAPEQGGQEVRLSINSDALRNTEIIIHRDAEGALSVSLSSADHNSFQTLVSSQSGLKQMLEANEKAEVRVSVTEGSQQEQNDSNQRSRGYMQYGPDEQ